MNQSKDDGVTGCHRQCLQLLSHRIRRPLAVAEAFPELAASPFQSRILHPAGDQCLFVEVCKKWCV